MSDYPMLISNKLHSFRNFPVTNIQVFYLFQAAPAGYICRILLQEQKEVSIHPLYCCHLLELARPFFLSATGTFTNHNFHIVFFKPNLTV